MDGPCRLIPAMAKQRDRDMKYLMAPVFAGLMALPAQANEFEPKLRSFLNDHILPWAFDAAIISAVVSQNAQNAALGQPDIDALDLEWRAQIGSGTTPLIDPVLSGPSADFLRSQVAASQGAITEIFTMDMHGLNVAASSTTSDFWQGDEAKFIETYMVGPTAVHIGDVEFDESTQSYQAQVSLTLVDPQSGQPVGAMTVGLNAEALF